MVILTSLFKIAKITSTGCGDPFSLLAVGYFFAVVPGLRPPIFSSVRWTAGSY
jgi:hypothetical protein